MGPYDGSRGFLKSFGAFLCFVPFKWHSITFAQYPNSSAQIRKEKKHDYSKIIRRFGNRYFDSGDYIRSDGRIT